jgi:MgtC family
MVIVDNEWLRLAEACAIGLLIGVERERNKGCGPYRASAGIRTFGATALAGALGETLGGTLLLSALALGTAALLAVAYYRTTTDDPGLTTEIALLTTLLLGGSQREIPRSRVQAELRSQSYSPPRFRCIGSFEQY